MEWEAFKKRVNLRVYKTRQMVNNAPNLTEQQRNDWFACRMGDFYYRVQDEMGKNFTREHKVYILESARQRKGVREIHGKM